MGVNNKNTIFYDSGVLIDGLYRLKLDNNFFESLLTIHQNVEIKRSSLNESSAYLWQNVWVMYLKERLKKLVKNEILTNLNFTDLDICLD